MLDDIVMQVLEKIAEQVDEETLGTIESVRKKIIEVQLMYDNGEIRGEGEYQETMAYLRKRLEELKAQ